MTQPASPNRTLIIDEAALKTTTRTVTRNGLLVFGLFFGLFLGWAALAPLYGAVISSGTVIVESSRKEIQHLEGGIVQDILVRDGQVVEKGEVLIRLSEEQSRSNLDLLTWRRTVSKVEEARLIAERDGHAFEPSEFGDLGQNQTRINEIVGNQLNIFNANKNAIASQTAILGRRVGELHEEIEGLTSQINAEERQLALIAQEIGDVSTLVEKGLAPRPRLLALQRSEAELKGSIGKNKSSIARARQTIGATELQKEDLLLEDVRRVAGEFKTIQSELLDLEEKIRSAEDIQARVEVRAPITGTIVNLQVFTSGGVIAPGKTVMEIVPANDKLIVEAQVSPQDIDEVAIGQSARVRFSAFSQRNAPPVDGQVITVSADRLVDERSGTVYFLARISLDQQALEGLTEGPITPGMQAEVFVVTKSRTLLSYLMEPLIYGLERGLRE